jgi:hypothetical protein
MLATAAAAAAIAFAPIAAADRDSDSREDSGRGSAKLDTRDMVRPGPPGVVSRPNAISQVPKGWLNEAQWARPGSGSNPFGAQPKPPVFALD